MKSPKLADSYVELTEALDRLGVPWALAGAFAVMTHSGRVRDTTDVDFLVAWHDELLETIEGVGFVVYRVHADPGDPPHVVRSRKGDDVADFLVALSDYQLTALDRSVDNLLTVEDVLVHKLIAGRPRDLDDIRAILAANDEFDKDYVRRWVDVFGFGPRLAEFGLDRGHA